MENNGIITSSEIYTNFGTLTGDGAFSGDFSNVGTLSAGKTVGTMSVGGNYIQAGLFSVDIIDTYNYDYLTVAGDVELWDDNFFPSGSSLGLNFLNGFSGDNLNDGDFFDIIRYRGSLEGAFSDTSLLSSMLTIGEWVIDYDFDFVDGSKSVRLSYDAPPAVPEPSTILLFGVGCATLAGFCRKRR